MKHRRVALAALAVLVLGVASRATAQSDFGAGTPESRYFRVDSAVATGRRGPQVEGYVYNLYDTHAIKMLLDVEALDADGRTLDRRVAYVPLDVPPHGRAFFRAPAPEGTTSARVTVRSFEWAPRGGGGGGM